MHAIVKWKIFRENIVLRCINWRKNRNKNEAWVKKYSNHSQIKRPVNYYLLLRKRKFIRYLLKQPLFVLWIAEKRHLYISSFYIMLIKMNVQKLFQTTLFSVYIQSINVCHSHSSEHTNIHWRGRLHATIHWCGFRFVTVPSCRRTIKVGWLWLFLTFEFRITIVHIYLQPPYIINKEISSTLIG